MNKLILSFILGIIATFFLVGGIDYIVHPDYPIEWDESLTVPQTFTDPWMPLTFIVQTARIWLFLAPCGFLIFSVVELYCILCEKRKTRIDIKSE